MGAEMSSSTDTAGWSWVVFKGLIFNVFVYHLPVGNHSETNLFYTYFKSVFVGAELKVLMCYMHIDLQPEWLALNE